MPTISDIRAQYPQYNDMSDADLANALHSKFYSDMPKAEFDAKVGTQPVAPAPALREGSHAPDSGGMTWRASFLPVGEDAEGKLALALPEFLHSALDTGAKIASGQDPRQTGTTEDVLNFAGMGGVGAAPAALKTVPTAIAEASPRSAAIQAADNLGIQIPKAAASDNFAVRATGAALKEMPVIGAPLVKASQTAIKGLEGKATEVADSLGSGSPLAAGHAVKDDLLDWVKGGSEDEANALYEPVRKAIGNKRGTLDNTENKIVSLVERAKAANLDPPAIVDTINKAANETRLQGGMSFEGMQTLRTEIGKRISGDIVPEPGLDKGALKTLYGSLTDDMGKIAGRNGSKGRVAWENANDVFKNDIVARRDIIEKVVGPKGNSSPEAVVATLRSMAGTGKGADFNRLLQVKRTVGEAAWNEFGSAIVKDMGRTPDGFSLARFRTAYENISNTGKHALFSAEHKQALDDIATVSRKFVALERLGNPSGSARIGIIATSIPSTIATLVMAPHLLLPIAAGIGSSAVLSAVLARPATAKVAARWMTTYLHAATKQNSGASAVLDQVSRQLINAMKAEGIEVPQAPDQSDNEARP